MDLDRVPSSSVEDFKKVIGVDVSETQIEQAKSKTESAHSLTIESSSVDLLTCGTAWHWLDPEIFYTEAKKVLKASGMHCCLLPWDQC